MPRRYRRGNSRAAEAAIIKYKEDEPEKDQREEKIEVKRRKIKPETRTRQLEHLTWAIEETERRKKEVDDEISEMREEVRVERQKRKDRYNARKKGIETTNDTDDEDGNETDESIRTDEEEDRKYCIISKHENYEEILDFLKKQNERKETYSIPHFVHHITYNEWVGNTEVVAKLNPKDLWYLSTLEQDQKTHFVFSEGWVYEGYEYPTILREDKDWLKKSHAVDYQDSLGQDYELDREDRYIRVPRNDGYTILKSEWASKTLGEKTKIREPKVYRDMKQEMDRLKRTDMPPGTLQNLDAIMEGQDLRSSPSSARAWKQFPNDPNRGFLHLSLMILMGHGALNLRYRKQIEERKIRYMVQPRVRFGKIKGEDCIMDMQGRLHLIERFDSIERNNVARSIQEILNKPSGGSDELLPMNKTIRSASKEEEEEDENLVSKLREEVNQGLIKVNNISQKMEQLEQDLRQVRKKHRMAEAEKRKLRETNERQERRIQEQEVEMERVRRQLDHNDESLRLTPKYVSTSQQTSHDESVRLTPKYVTTSQQTSPDTRDEKYEELRTEAREMEQRLKDEKDKLEKQLSQLRESHATQTSTETGRDEQDEETMATYYREQMETQAQGRMQAEKKARVLEKEKEKHKDQISQIKVDHEHQLAQLMAERDKAVQNNRDMEKNIENWEKGDSKWRRIATWQSLRLRKNYEDARDIYEMMCEGRTWKGIPEDKIKRAMDYVELRDDGQLAFHDDEEEEEEEVPSAEEYGTQKRLLEIDDLPDAKRQRVDSEAPPTGDETTL